MSGAGGRRRARPQRAPVRLVAGIGAGLALAAVLAETAADGAGSAAAGTAASTQAVRSAELACPGTVAGGAESEVVLVAPPEPEPTAAPTAPGPGVATVAELGPAAEDRAQLERPGRTTVAAGDETAPALVTRGTGGLARGLAAEQVTTAGSGAARSLAAAGCLAADTSAWFVGASTAAGRRDRLVLTNPERTEALVDLRFFTGTGPLEVPNSTGIAVGPQAAVSIPLDGMVPGHDRLAVAVAATRGRIAAALHDQQLDGVLSRGADWIGAAPEPRRTVVIPGLPAGALGRTLQVLAPGRRDATVQVRLLTENRDFAPAGADTLDLRSGEVAETDLAAAVGEQAVTVVLTSDRPIVAAVRLTRTGGRDDGTDIAYATAAGALTDPAALAAGRGGSDNATAIALAAPEEAATVTVLPLTADGPGTPQTITIPAGRSVLVDPRPGKAEQFSVLITPQPDSGRVHAARVLSRGDSDLTVSPLRSGSYTVTVPGVVADVTAVTAQD